MRATAKMVNYAVLYGKTRFTLEEAADLIDAVHIGFEIASSPVLAPVQLLIMGGSAAYGHMLSAEVATGNANPETVEEWAEFSREKYFL